MTYKLIGAIPAGRRRYLELLVPHLVASHGLFHEFQLWMNTTHPEDLAYLQQLAQEYAGFFRLVPPEMPILGIATIAHYWKHTCDPEAIYLRLDDDIIWMEPDAIRKLVAYREAHPEPLLVYGNIINNLICTYLHQHFGAVPLSLGVTRYHAMDPELWASGPFAEATHRCFLTALQEGTADRYRFDRWRLCGYERASINVISWFGRDIRPNEYHYMNGDDETWVGETRPHQLRRPNEICGQALFAHFSYHKQRRHMDQTDILEQYRRWVPTRS